MDFFNVTPHTQRPPAMCPKCGSHRTEIVGYSTDRQTVVIRCNGCGERSKIEATPEDQALPPRVLATQLQRVLDWQHT